MPTDVQVGRVVCDVTARHPYGKKESCFEGLFPVSL